MWVNAEPQSRELLPSGEYRIGMLYSTDDLEPRLYGGLILLGIGQGIDEFNAAVIRQLDDFNAQDALLASKNDLEAVVDSIFASGPVDVAAVRQAILAKTTGTVDATPVVPAPPVTSTSVLP